MQPRETEDAIFGHKVIETNGNSIILPSELDPHMKSRALTLLEARTIIAALTGRSVEEVPVPEMFNPITEQGPESTRLVEEETDPSLTARQAALSTQDMRDSQVDLGMAA